MPKEAPPAELVAAVHEGRHVLPAALRREISPIPCIAENTVKSHIGSVLRKLGAEDRAHAATLAAQRGFMRV